MAERETMGEAPVAAQGRSVPRRRGRRAGLGTESGGGARRNAS